MTPRQFSKSDTISYYVCVRLGPASCCQASGNDTDTSQQKLAPFCHSVRQTNIETNVTNEFRCHHVWSFHVCQSRTCHRQSSPPSLTRATVTCVTIENRNAGIYSLGGPAKTGLHFLKLGSARRHRQSVPLCFNSGGARTKACPLLGTASALPATNHLSQQHSTCTTVRCSHKKTPHCVPGGLVWENPENDEFYAARPLFRCRDVDALPCPCGWLLETPPSSASGRRRKQRHLWTPSCGTAACARARPVLPPHEATSQRPDHVSMFFPWCFHNATSAQFTTSWERRCSLTCLFVCLLSPLYGRAEPTHERDFEKPDTAED